MSTPIPPLSPAPASWDSHEHIAQQAQRWLEELGLSQWQFGWDRAIRRLGSCSGSKSRITLSRHFVQHYLGRDEQTQRIITDTLLHELAHALAWHRHQAQGHGVIWRHYCALLGIPRERSTTRCESFGKPRKRYALIISDTNEVVRYYSRKPRLSTAKLKRSYMPKRKAETLGKLKLIELDSLSTLTRKPDHE